MRTFRFQFEIVCASDGQADMGRVEELIDLNMQDLVYDDAFIEALDEKEAVAIQVKQIG
jgi:hypothetical protein